MATEESGIKITKEEEYRGIKYVLKLLHSKEFESVKRLGIRAIGVDGKWWVVENDNTQKEIKDLWSQLNDELGIYHYFLYEDSLHSWNDNQTLDEREEAMRNCARRDIDMFLDKFPELIEKKIESLKEDKKKAEGIINGLKREK